MACPCLDEEILQVQDNKFIERIETTLWSGCMFLGEFEDGKLYIELEFDGGAPSVTPVHCLLGTEWEGIPYHVTLGRASNSVAKKAAHQLLLQTGRFSVQFKKMSWRREKTAYAVVGGSLLTVLRQLEEFGFRPRGDWHVSL